MGNFGVAVPFQEIPEEYYTIRKLDEVAMSDFDAAVVVGAFNPWIIVATGQTEWLGRAHAAGRVITAICHGPTAAARADLVDGRRVTDWMAAMDSAEIIGGGVRSGRVGCGNRRVAGQRADAPRDTGVRRRDQRGASRVGIRRVRCRSIGVKAESWVGEDVFVKPPARTFHSAGK